jgi:hypothetical protein
MTVVRHIAEDDCVASDWLAEPAYRPPSRFCLQLHHSEEPKRYLSQYDDALLVLAIAKKMSAAIIIRIIPPVVD